MMKKILTGILCLSLFTFAKAQDSASAKNKTDWSKVDLSNRANDHFMLQYGYDGWINTPDSINPSGFSRHFNFYFMYDKPFKSNPHFSAAIGIGLGSSNIFFENTYINLKSTGSLLPFTDVSATDHFKKYKLTTLFLEAPVELRYAGDAVSPDKGFKFALGVKVGTLMKSYTKGKNLVNAGGTSVYGDKYISKEQNKKFINSTRFAGTVRIGYGVISVDGSYQFTNFLKTGAGAQFNPYSIGLTLSAL